MNRLPVFIICCSLGLLGACQSTAANAVTNPAFAATAQLDQYQRDAKATLEARDATQAALAWEIQITAEAAAAQAARQAQSAVNTQAAITQQAVAAATSTAAFWATDSIARTAASIAATEQAAAKTATHEFERQSATQTAGAIMSETHLRLQREQTQLQLQQVMVMALFLVMVVALCVGVWWLWQFQKAQVAGKVKRESVVAHGVNGQNVMLLLNGPRGEQVVLDPRALPTAALTLHPNGALTPLTPFTAVEQARAILLRAAIEWAQAQHAPFPPVAGQPPQEVVHRHKNFAGEWEEIIKTGALPSTTPPQLTPARPPASLGAPPLELTTPNLPHEADWTLLNDWQGQALPLGVGAHGLLLADPEDAPHLLIAGASGSGKTRYGLRPLIAAALATGWQVFIFDRSGLDFLPFRQHPNARVIVLSQMRAAIDYLTHLFAEMEQRFQVLREQGVSTWGRLPGAGPRWLGVFDEFSNLADSLERPDRDELWRRARMVAAEGRKAGIHLALGLQDPTHRSLDLRIRRNCTPLSFRVKDSDASRVILNTAGAETLPPRQFLTNLHNTLARGVAFAPDDDELTRFLTARPVPAQPAPGWVTDPALAPAPARPSLNQMDELVEALRPAWEAGTRSKRALARSVGKEYAGAFAAKLDRALEQLRATTTATTAENGATAGERAE